MGNAKINYIQIIKDLQAQFDAVLETVKQSANIEDEETFKELQTVKAISVSDEQYFANREKDKKISPNTIYIVAKFGSAPVNFASSVITLSLRVVATENKIKPTQLILGEFVTAYNLQSLNEDCTQVWQTPTVISNFNPTHSAYRSLFSLTGVVVVGQNTLDVYVTYITDVEDSSTVSGYKEEIVALMSFDEGYQASPNPQPFGNTYGFAKTEINFGTDSITFSTYLLNTQLVADVMSARGMTVVLPDATEYSSTKGMNDIFKFRIKYTNGYANNNEVLQKYKLISYRNGKKIGDIPSFTVSFSY